MGSWANPALFLNNTQSFIGGQAAGVVGNLTGRLNFGGGYPSSSSDVITVWDSDQGSTNAAAAGLLTTQGRRVMQPKDIGLGVDMIDPTTSIQLSRRWWAGGAEIAFTNLLTHFQMITSRTLLALERNAIQTNDSRGPGTNLRANGTKLFSINGLRRFALARHIYTPSRITRAANPLFSSVTPRMYRLRT